jgi:dethiobiotin synthetase
MNAPGTIPPFSFDVSRWPALPRLGGLFVTGTDTGVGKTLIAGAIARSLRRVGTPVDVFKPAATGCRAARGQLVSQDAEFLAACADSMRMLAEIAPVRYRTAVAPNVAAELEHRPVDLPLIFDAYRRLGVGRAETRRPLVVVEGIGGLLCPIADDFWVIHLARMMALPVVIVARAGLGTINHTLLTLHAARSAGLRVAGVVLNRYLIDPLAGKSGDSPRFSHFRKTENGDSPRPSGEDVDMAMFTNSKQVEALGRTKVLALVPEEPANSIEMAVVGPDTQFAIDQVDWARLAQGNA